MNIQAQSQIGFGEEEPLRDFFFVHRLVHLQVDGVIVNAGGGSMPNATIDSERALEGWIAQMRRGRDPNMIAEPGAAYALSDWLQLHDNLHQAEYAALRLGLAPALSEVDFTQQNQFYDWMYAHSAIHDTLDQATGTA